MIQAAIFDMGNVLAYFSYEKMFKQACSLTQLEDSFLREKLLELGIQYELGALTTHELYLYFTSLSKATFSEEEFCLAISDIFIDNTSIHPIIHSLKKQNIPLILLSNTCPAHYQFLMKHHSIIELFDTHILSYEVGARKPDRAIFEAALFYAGCSADRCFYTDDIKEYVDAARSLGIDSEIYTDSPLLIENLRKRQCQL